MKKKLIVQLFFLLMVMVPCIKGNAANNPYPTSQNVDGDAYYEIPCTYFAWQQVYDNLGIALPAWGNAGNWYSAAQNAGYATGSVAKSGSIAVWTGDTYGHVAYVTSANGTTFVVNEGGRTDLDQTSSHGVKYGYTITNAVGQARPYDSGKTLVGFIYPGQAAHTHSYSSTVTKQPTCTQTGVRTYRCSCGSSYTETIAATGHKYVNTVVAPTLTEKGYTKHTCSVCNNTYKDTYVDPPKENADGWYYCDSVPTGIAANQYTIEYNNHYEKIQATSPGTGWKNAATVKDEWQNSGAQYDSEQDLPTSNERVLVNSVYYHFCGPNAGANGNYEQTSKFVHYDGVAAGSVTVTSSGMDGTHPYYLLNWNNGNGTVYCQSGVTCDGAYGSHGKRCKAWYKMNTYQNRVHVVQYKFTKDSGWTSKRDSSAASAKIRFKAIEPEKKSYKVTFMDGEKIIKTEDVLEGKAATAPACEKAGYVLSWDKVFDNVTSDLIVNAVWTEKKDNGNQETKNDQKSTENNNQGSSEQPSIDNNKQQNTDKQPNTEQQSTADKKQENKNTSSYREKKQDQVKGLKIKAKGSGKLYIKWQWVLTADKYKVLVSTNKNFQHAKKKYTYLRKITFKNLKKGKKYYVKVQAMTKKGKRKYKYGPWSGVKRVKVK